MSVSYDRVDCWEVRGCDGGFGVFDDDRLVSGPHVSRSVAIQAALDLPQPLPDKLVSHRVRADDTEHIEASDVLRRTAPHMVFIENERLFHAEADRRVGAATR